MSPKTATLGMVSLLLLLSAICAGGRRYLDAQQEAALRRPAGEVATPSLPHGQRDEAGSGKIAKPDSGSDADSLRKRLRTALLHQDEASRTRAMLELVSRFKAEDWEPALAALEKMGISRGATHWNFILEAWTEAEPEAALNWSNETKAGGTIAWKAWIARDPDAALASLAARKGDDWSTASLLRARLIEAFQKDLPRLGRLLAGISDEKILETAVQQAHADLKQHKPEDLKAWITTLDPSVKPYGFRLVMTGLPDHQAKVDLAHEFPDLTEPYHYSQIYGAWAKVDPAAASAALEKMEPGTLQNHAMMGIAYVLSGKGDHAGAFALTHRYPDELMNVFMSDLIMEATDEHPELAIKEIPRLEYERSRVARYGLVLASWLKKDPAAAKEWLEENEIPYQVQQELKEQGLLEK